MSELKDSAMIKLFGQTIPFSVVKQNQQPEVLVYEPCSNVDDEESYNNEDYKENSGNELIQDKQDDDDDSCSQQMTEDLKDPTTASSGVNDNPKTPSFNRETSPLKNSENGEQSDTSNSQEKTLKKPDKILPCPRCNSMETKFCYYNNYNVNQPRHFCKNCQRYWTAGGTMRNVPVGAGRRKNKSSSSASHYRQIMISEALRTVHANAANGLVHNGTVLTFGSDSSPLCESVTSVLSLSDKRQNCVQNRFHSSTDDHSSGCSITGSNSSEKGSNSGQNYQNSAPLPYFPGPPPWPYQWQAPMPPPGLYPSGYPVSYCPETTYWGYTVPGHWNMQYIPPTNSFPPPTTPTLGKHSRDSEKEEQHSRGGSNNNNSERSILVPKTLRFDDPTEAAKSSIWTTLGIKSDKTSPGEGLFKGFHHSKGGGNDNKNYNIAETSSAALQVNPAALSRSLNFHEST